MTAPYTLAQLADILKLPFQGDPTYRIDQVRDLEWLSDANPAVPHAIYWISAKKILKRNPIGQSVSCVLTAPALADAFPHALLVEEDNSKVALAALLRCFKQHAAAPDPEGRLVAASAVIGEGTVIYPGAVIMDHADIGPDVRIMPGAVIESHAVIGARTVIHANAVIGHHCKIGHDCIIHATVVLGADGFGFHDQGGLRHKLEQIGIVEIGNHVELGAGCTIDRAAIEATRIGDFTKLDNQVHIAHNTQVGRYCYIAACTGIAGSTLIEDQVVIGGMVAIADHVRVCRGAYISSMSGILQDVEQPGVYFGIPVRPAREMHKIQAALKYLPEMVRTRKKDESAG